MRTGNRGHALSRAVHVVVCAMGLGIGGLSPELQAQAGIGGAPSHAEVQARLAQFDIKAGPLSQALDMFGRQSGLHLLYEPELVQGRAAVAVSGQMAVRDALRRLLGDGELTWEFVSGDSLVIKQARAPVKSGEGRGGAAGQTRKDDDVVGMPAVMVKGARTLNVDIERTVDDPQPYVIFDRRNIERSGASNLTDFLMTRLPMNTAGAPLSQLTPDNGGLSNVNLRGLGQGQTLILIDGRRLAKTSRGSSSGQPDINGIPLAAIERIEVLPTTASAIYGGSATGGVINIVMRRDYAGSQVALTYDNSFDSDSAVKRVDLSSGFSLFGGRTSVLLAGSYVERNALLIRDRDMVEQGRERILRNNPDRFFSPPQSLGTNIRSVSGQALILDDGTPLSASFTSLPVGYAGFASDGGAALLANAGTYNVAASDNVAPVAGAGGNASIIGGDPPSKYLSVSARHDFSERISGFVEASHSENNTRQYGRGIALPATIPAAAPSNPFQQDILVAWSTGQIGRKFDIKSGYDRYSTGLVFQLPGEWAVSADYTLSRSKYHRIDDTPYMESVPARFYADIASGRIDVLRDFDSQGIDIAQYLSNDFTIRQSPLRVTTKNPAIRLGGPVGSLEGGKPWLSLLLERQDSVFGAGSLLGGNGSRQAFPERSQRMDSAYMELRVPVVSSLNAVSWIKELELQLAGRLDEYASVNAAQLSCSTPSCSLPEFTYIRAGQRKFSPLVALRFKPADSVALRASYGKGFLPPDINQLTAPAQWYAQDVSYLIDPRRGNTSPIQRADTVTGGNPELEPEVSTTWSAGVIFTPAWMEDLRISVDYTRIEKRDNITSLTAQTILDNEAHFPGRVIRGANLPGDPEGWAGPITGIDYTMINAASTRLQAYDVQVDYTIHAGGKGDFWFSGMATWQKQFQLQTVASAPFADYLGWTSTGNSSTPLEFRGNLSVEWSLDAWTVGWTGRYFSSYYVADPSSPASAAIFLAQGNGGRVSSQTYHDLYGRYRLASRGNAGLASALLDGLEIQVGVRNLFDRKPPFDASSFYYLHSGLGDPRLATYYITLKQDF